MVTPSTSFFIQSFNPDSSRSFLSFDGKKPVGVKGVYVEFQASIENNYLGMFTEDVPYEETLHLYYFNNTFDVLDYVSIGRMYHFAIFECIEIIQPDKIVFDFLRGDSYWVLPF